ncbi:uncharacterized protein BYT42DRAFT_547617 [Radiomyces spectabilis]|uniref:uncharacterized protein n=1 Tax=Radiomyces spectabilis TaxID=64574 RepID=UPI00221F6FDE|nr:uncharacterized protein BYT42DRAFT_547617 [Radiomyces spectabilis]KAI8374603.1 hypothetical protein BYT42DRAFT_547617 [Radiomyces spectabilis]
MSHILTKKQEEKNLQCSGLVREVGHRVKSISASTFSGPEVVAIQQGGNEIARRIWLSTYNSSTTEPETDNDVRLFMRQKYYEQKWLNREKLKEHAELVKALVRQMFTEDGVRRPRVPTPPLPTDHQNASTSYFPPQSKSPEKMSTRPSPQPSASWIEDNTPLAMTPGGQTVRQIPEKLKIIPHAERVSDKNQSPVPHSAPFAFGYGGGSFSIPSPSIQSGPTSPRSSASPVVSSVMNRAASQMTSPTFASNSFLSELAGLDSPPIVNKATYTGGILVPNSPTTSTPLSPSMNSPQTLQSSLSKPSIGSTPHTVKSENKSFTPVSAFDPYAALRDLTLSDHPNKSSSANQPTNASPYNYGKVGSQKPRPQSLQPQKSSTTNALWGEFTSADDSLSRSNAFSSLDPLAQWKK